MAHLIEENLRYAKNDAGIKTAIINAIREIRGTYGLAIIINAWPDKLILVKNASPLVIGVGDGEYLAASDASAIMERTRNVIYMQDNEMAFLTKKGFKLFNISLPEKTSRKKMDLKNINVSNRKEKLELTSNSAQKSGYPHFMLKEIFEQPESIENSLRGRLIKSRGLARLGGLESVRDRLKRIERIIITGCGTAYLVGLVGKHMIEELTGIPCEAELASELRYCSNFANCQNLAMVAISQSGETADTLAVLREAKEKNILTLGIVNVVGSSIARETDAGVYNHIGPEIGVASTKAFTSQLAVLTLLALFLGRQRNMSLIMGRRIAEELQKIPRLAKQILDKNNSKIKQLAKKYSVKGAHLAEDDESRRELASDRKDYNNFLYIGRKYNFPVACEGALKLKEIAYIHAEGYGAGEMKHGPIAMIDENFPTVAIAPVDSVYEKMASNMEEIKARHGKIIAITTEGNEKIKHIADDWLYIPSIST